MKNKNFIVFLEILSFFFIGICLNSCRTTNLIEEDTSSTEQEYMANPEEIPVEEAVIPAPEVASLVTEAEPIEAPAKEKEIKRSLEQQKFFEIKNTRDYNTIGLMLDYKITVDDEAKEIIILYEESIEDEDYENQYLAFPWPLKLDDKTIWTTYGYAKIYNSAKNQPIDEFYALWLEHPDYKIIFRGWSLGSALAKITARHFLIRAPEGTMIDEITTFGDVKCWVNPFYSLEKYCKKIREYVNMNDVITWCVPFYWRDVYCRVGGNMNLKKLFNCEYVHTHYDELDYSEWEDEE